MIGILVTVLLRRKQRKEARPKSDTLLKFLRNAGKSVYILAHFGKSFKKLATRLLKQLLKGS